MIKAVLSDIGNVILPVQADVFVENLASNAGVSFSEAHKMVYSSIGLEAEINRGEITMQEYFESNLTHLGSLDFEGFKKAWLTLLGDDFPEIKQAYHKLKVPLYILSNINDVHASVLHKHWLDELAVEFWASNEVGMMKPEPKIFEFVLGEMGYQPDEILFFDDLQENIDTAVGLGIKSKLVTRPGDVIKTLEEYKLI